MIILNSEDEANKQLIVCGTNKKMFIVTTPPDNNPTALKEEFISSIESAITVDFDSDGWIYMIEQLQTT